jgi:invasion protein IalB
LKEFAKMSGFHRRIGAVLVAGAIAATASPALAQSVRVLSEHNAWTAYSTTESEGQICFVLSRPTATEPSDAASEGYFYITHRPDQGVRSEINIVTGYALEAEGTASIDIGGQSFALYTQDDAAWLADTGQTDAAIQAIRGGSTMVVEGTSADGTTVRQTFSLSGATAATNAIDGAC